MTASADCNTLNTRALRDAFGCFMTGVTVVTTHDTQNNPIGFTANSFTSVSLTPPLVLVCVAKKSSSSGLFCTAQRFAINVLSETQLDISDTFARPSENRFANVAWHCGPFGSPILERVSAWFDCAMHKTLDAGDHWILIGEVKAFDSATTAGLGYARGAYFTPTAETRALNGKTAMAVSALIIQNGKVLVHEQSDQGLTLPTKTDVVGGVQDAIHSLIKESGIHAKPGFVYSVYTDKASSIQHLAFLCSAEAGAPRKGAFLDLTTDNLARITDPAMRAMLERYAEESLFGNFGTYLGTDLSGDVRPLSDRINNS